MVATLAGAAVGAVLGAVTKNVVAQAFKLVEKRYKLWKDFPDDVDFIKTELLMIAGAEEDQLSEKGDPRAVRSISMEEMRDLAHDIEDCLDRILRHAEGERDPSSSSSFLQPLKKVGVPPYATEIKKLKERLKAAHQRKQDYNVNGSQQAATSSAFPAITEVEPVGIDKPKSDIIELLNDIEGQPEHLKVISIVGIGGSGKSTLAKAVYDSPDIDTRFPDRAWVPASEHRGDIKGLLMALLEKLRPGEPVSGDQQQFRKDITKILNTKRYLIVLDGIEEQQWYHIKSTFPEKPRSKIIVTTTAQAVGKVCSHGNGHVYNMTTLNVNHSTELLEAVFPGLEQNSASLVKKCDGHPLALVSVANYLLRENALTKMACEQVFQSLGYHMANKDAFSKLQQVLLANYSSLPGNPLKTCLLYTCVFPNGHTISSNSLMRRWLAEGYVQGQHPRSALLIADENLKELIGRNILRQIDSNKSAKVKTCRAHGIMHEFILHMAMSAKFITSLGDQKRSDYRHLFLENSSSGKAPDIKHCHTSQASASSSRDKRPEPFFHYRKKNSSSREEFRARSLTICGSAGDAVADFTKCELLRVLDLEECSDLEDDHMNDLHELWHLKYLSLGATISRLPKKFEKLHCLETLDLRKTKIETLPLEVVKLPHLTHLLGKFKLLFGKKDLKMNEAHKFFPKESNLQTLAGFVADDDPVFSKLFSMVMVHMKKLRKVKIWYNSTGEDSKSLTNLSTAINKFIQDELDTSVGVRSLSLDLGNSTSNILRSLFSRSLDNSYGYLSSLKLHGALSRLTGFATSLCGLTELCLSSTNNLTSNDLSNLSKLKHLEYLKLVKVSLGGFIIRRRDFPRLVGLCLVQSPTLPTIEEGAMPKLISLQLLCEDLVGLSGIAIEWHKHLQEVALDSMVNSETITMWENEAKKHPKRPRVLFLRRLGPGVLKYVATERPSPGTDCPIVRGKQEIHEVQQNLAIDIESAFKRINFSGPSMTSPELPSARNDAMPSSSREVS